MEGGIQLDTRQFDAAMKEYSYYTSKSLVDAVNGKARDLAFMAARHTSYAKRRDIEEVVENPMFIIWFLNQKYGHHRKSGVGGWSSRDYLEAEKKIRNRRLRSIKFMKSGYVKAGHKFPTTEASKEIAKSVLKHKGSSAQAVIAAAKNIVASMNISWEANEFESWKKFYGSDAKAKEELVNRSISAALVLVTADMQKYIERKQAQLGRKHSA